MHRRPTSLVTFTLLLALSALPVAGQRVEPPATRPFRDPDITLLGPRANLSQDQQSVADKILNLLLDYQDERANDTLREYLQVHPFDASALVLRACFFYFRDEPAAARPFLETVAASADRTNLSIAARYALDIPTSTQPFATAGTIADMAAAAPDMVPLNLLAGVINNRMGNDNAASNSLDRFFDRLGRPPMIARVFMDLMDMNASSNGAALDDVLLRRRDHIEHYPGLRSDRGLARTLHAMGRFEDADKALDAALARDPQDLPSLTLRAAIKFDLHQYDAVLAVTEKALDKDPFCGPANTLRARALMKLGRTADAQAAIFRAIRLPETPDPPPLLNIARANVLTPDKGSAEAFNYFSAGKPEEAQRLLTQLLQRHPDDQRLLLFRGLCGVYMMTRREQGEADLERAAEVDPDSPAGLCAAAVRSLRQLNEGRTLTGTPDETLTADIAVQAARHPDDPLLLWAAGTSSISVHAYTFAVDYYHDLNKLLAIGPSIYHHQYANALDHLGNHHAALAHRYAALLLEEGGWTYAALGYTLGLLRQWDDADEAFAQSIARFGQFADRWDQWADTLFNAGRYAQAAEKYQKTAALDPKEPDYARWGYCLETLKMPRQALTVYEKGLSLFPNLQDLRAPAAALRTSGVTPAPLEPPKPAN